MTRQKTNLTPAQRANVDQAIEKAGKLRLAWGIADIATATGLSEPFIRLKIHTGELRAKLVGRRVLVMDDDLRAFLAQVDYRPSEAAA